MIGKKNKQMFTPSFPLLGPMPGPTLPSTGESASACFGRFFTDKLLVVETNRFAVQFIVSQSASRPRLWHDVN